MPLRSSSTSAERRAYESFRDFITRQSDKNVNRRVIEALIKTGAFDSLGADRAQLLNDLDSELAEAESLRKDREAGQANLFGDLLGMDDCGSGDSSGSAPTRNVPSMPMSEKLGFERELLGFYISGHPMDAYAGLDLAIDTFQSPEELVDFNDRTTFRIRDHQQLSDQIYSKRQQTDGGLQPRDTFEEL